MSEPLTREQVEQIFAQRMDEQAFSVLLATDAALREQLAQVTQERDNHNTQWHVLFRANHDLVQQLATAQARITRLEGALREVGCRNSLAKCDMVSVSCVVCQALAKEEP